MAAKIDNAESVGYQRLIDDYSLQVLAPRRKSFILQKGKRRTVEHEGGRFCDEYYPKGYRPEQSLGPQLEFALKHEGIELEILSALFHAVDPDELTAYVAEKPTGVYARRAWCLYEFLTRKKLRLPDLTQGNYVHLLDPEDHYTCTPTLSRRHRIKNNLLGDADFCPTVRRTDALRVYEEGKLDERSREVIRQYPTDILQRALSYLFVKETKSSFEIERATPDQRRTARFVDLLQKADQRDFCNKSSLIELQEATVDERFANHDYRGDQNYVGQTVSYGSEVIHYVPPKAEDVLGMMNALFVAHQNMLRSGVFPPVLAAVVSFGFVFIHPFDDGNGRIHRFLIHNILAQTGFVPDGFILPVSATMLANMQRYDEALEWFSKRLMPLVDYELDRDGAMSVKNDTALHYRYIDMTCIAERLLEFVKETIETELPLELDYLVKYDNAKRLIEDVVDMGDRRIDDFIKFCNQNDGRLAKRKRESHFAALTDDEIARMEQCFRDAYGASFRKKV